MERYKNQPPLNQEESKKAKEIKDLHLFSFNIPKIELHAHIGGCIRSETFMELAEAKGISIDHLDFYNMSL